MARTKRTGDSPIVVLLGGPNGAGKSTAAPHLLKGSLHVVEFLNADLIARGLSPFDLRGGLFSLYRPIATTWQVYDNSQEAGIALIAEGRHASATCVALEELWDRIQRK